MEIKVYRFSSDTDSTLSAIHIDGKFLCYGLEDEHRTVKVWGETRIPKGKYKVGMRTEGGHNSRYSKKFPSFHKGMLHVLDVPNFQYILIHIGNTDDDTAGCLLVGQECNNNRIDKGCLLGSTLAYREFYLKVCNEAINGTLSIEYIDL
jgi:hypothetical protein